MAVTEDIKKTLRTENKHKNGRSKSFHISNYFKCKWIKLLIQWIKCKQIKRQDEFFKIHLYTKRGDSF
jgi:hypothetical protein